MLFLRIAHRYSKLLLIIFKIKMLAMKLGLVLFFILCASVSTRVVTETFEKDLPASPQQIIQLADSVCTMFFYDSKTRFKECLSNFLNKRDDQNWRENLPTLQITCQTYDTVSFSVTPSKLKLLITLVSENYENETIDYTVIEQFKADDTFRLQSGNYSLWSTILNDDGRISQWKRGPYVVEKIKRNEENKSYDIDINFLKPLSAKNSSIVSVNIVWNSTEESDSFHVINTCKGKTQGDFFYKNIRPCEKRNVTINDLLVNDNCIVKVKGWYGTTEKKYRTPACNHQDCFIYRAKNLRAHTTKNSDGSWSVQVAWNKPKYTPDKNNVTLSTSNTNQSVLLQGNVTELQFKDIKGRGIYNVMVQVQVDKKTETTSISGTFPEEFDASLPLSLLMGVWAAAIVVVGALLTVLFLWKRRLHLNDAKNYIYRNGLEIFQNDDSEDLEPGSRDQWEVRPERVRLHEVIGEGAFGVVRRGTLAPFNKDVAVKMLKDFPSVEEVRSFRAEMELMKSVGVHSHLVSLVGCCSGRRPLIIAEYCSRGDLLSYLRCSWDIMISRRNTKYYNNNKEGTNYRNDLFRNKPVDSKFATNRLYDIQGVCDTELTLPDLLSFCRQIAKGMEFLASNRVVHRDLAARNILVTSDRTLKIADFGLSRDIYQDNQYKQKGNGKLPVKWMALESLTHRIYTTQSDVWSFGVVIWEVVTVGGSPYAGVSAARLPRLLTAGYRMPKPPNCSPGLYKLMLSCWNERPRSRPTFAMLHSNLDELLCAVCADHYLCLSMPVDIPETHSKPYRYVRMLIRGRRKRAKSYERPLAALTNHYTEQPLVTHS